MTYRNIIKIISFNVQQTIIKIQTFYTNFIILKIKRFPSKLERMILYWYLNRTLIIVRGIFIVLCVMFRSRDSSVGMASGHGLEDRGVRVRIPEGSRIFSMSSRPVLGSTQPPIQWIPGAISPGVKLPGREADHSPPASAEVKKMWIYTSTPPYAFIA
jgi:hypothetical protein